MSELASSSPRLWERAQGLLVPVLLLAAWAGVVDTGLARNALLVPLHRVLLAPWADPDGRQLWHALAASLGRVALGIALGGSLGLAVGTLLGMRRALRRMVSPTVHAARQIALFAWIPLLTTWFGNGEAAKTVFISLSAFFPMFLAAERGVRQVPADLAEAALALRLAPARRLRLLVLPAALPSIFIGMEVALITSWIGTVGAEYAIGSGIGIGAFLAAARDVFRMDLVLLGVACMALVGYVLNRGARWAARRLAPWSTAS